MRRSMARIYGSCSLLARAAALTIASRCAGVRRPSATHCAATSSTFSPPLTIPYGLMATGMTILVAQLALQSIGHFVAREGRP